MFRQPILSSVANVKKSVKSKRESVVLRSCAMDTSDSAEMRNLVSPRVKSRGSSARRQNDSRQSWGLQDLLVTLSTLLRGSIYEKLRWTFKLYDINGDGCITRSELGEVVTAVHELMGKRHHAEEERKAREQLDRVFKKLDLNQDGVITIEEFIESCLKVRLPTYP